MSLWAHHYRRGPEGTAEYSDSFSRWSGAGNSEFRRNVEKAYAQKSRVRLVVASTVETAHVQSGSDASKIRKDFEAKEDLIGEVVLLEGENYVLRFRKVTSL